MEEIPEKSNFFVLDTICNSIDNSTNYGYNTLLDDCSTEVELKNFLINSNSLTTLNHNSNLNYSEFNNSINNESNNEKNFSMGNLNNSNEIMCITKNDVFFANSLIQKSFCSFNPINNNSNSFNQNETNLQPLNNPPNTFYSKKIKLSSENDIANDKNSIKPDFPIQNKNSLNNHFKGENPKLSNKDSVSFKINKNVVVNQNSRQSHNEKERKRRSRMKKSCEMLRNLVPGISEKTDKATVLECTVQYLIKLQKCLETK